MKKVDGIRYSMSWEDPSFLVESIKPEDQVLMVGSAGCLPISALTRSPERVQVVDVNADQIRLIRLKKITLQNLDYGQAMEFLGCFENRSTNKGRIAAFNNFSNSLPGIDLKQWENEIDKLSRGIIHEGRFEKYLRFFSSKILPLCCSKNAIQDFCQAKDLSEQRRIYETEINTKRYRLLFKWFFGKLIMKKTGRHPQLLKHVQGNTGEEFYERMKRAWTGIPIAQNYFFRYILQGYFNPDLPLPLWAAPENYDTINAQLDKLYLSQANLIDHLSETRANSWDLIYLSNITEVMSEEEAQVLFELCRKALKTSGKLILWNNLVERKPANGFEYIKLSEQLWNERMDCMYGFAGIYQRND